MSCHHYHNKTQRGHCKRSVGSHSKWENTTVCLPFISVMTWVQASKTDAGLFPDWKTNEPQSRSRNICDTFFFSLFFLLLLSLFFLFFLFFFSIFSCAQNLSYKIRPNCASINRSVIARHIQNHLSAWGYDGSICTACNWHDAHSSCMRPQVIMLTFQSSHPHSRMNTHPTQDHVSTAHYLFFTK